jgi:hypothetical protein
MTANDRVALLKTPRAGLRQRDFLSSMCKISLTIGTLMFLLNIEETISTKVMVEVLAV